MFIYFDEPWKTDNGTTRWFYSGQSTERPEMPSWTADREDQAETFPTMETAQARLNELAHYYTDRRTPYLGLAIGGQA